MRRLNQPALPTSRTGAGELWCGFWWFLVVFGVVSGRSLGVVCIVKLNLTSSGNFKRLGLGLGLGPAQPLRHHRAWPSTAFSRALDALDDGLHLETCQSKINTQTFATQRLQRGAFVVPLVRFLNDATNLIEHTIPQRPHREGKANAAQAASPTEAWR